MSLKRILFLSLILALYINSFSQQQTVYNFLRLDADARSASLAGSFVATSNDVNGIHYNPSSLATYENKKASVGFYKYLLDINSGNAAYSQKIKNYGYFGVGIKYVNYGSFDKYDDNFNNTGTFGANDLAITFAYANKYAEKLKIGAGLKFIYSSIDDYNSIAIATDLGAMYTLDEKSFNIGLSILNIGTQLKTYSGTRENLPIDLRAGISKKLEYLPLTFNIGFSNLADSYDNFFERFKNIIVGGEFSVSDNINLRLGYNNPLRQNYKTGNSIGLAGFSAGIGIKFKEIYRIDYAYNSFGNLGGTHRINIGFDLK